MRTRKNLFLLMMITIVVIVMGIGYSAINSVTGEIAGNLKAEAQEGVFITDVAVESNVDANISNSKIQKYVGTLMQSTV